MTETCPGCGGILKADRYHGIIVCAQCGTDWPNMKVVEHHRERIANHATRGEVSDLPPITTVEHAISAALDEGFMSMAGAKLLAEEVKRLRRVLDEIADSSPNWMEEGAIHNCLGHVQELAREAAEAAAKEKT